MIRSLRLAALCLIAPNALPAQTVVQAEPPLDSTRLELRDALVVLRDSLVVVNGAAVRLQRDVQQASSASLLSRAQVMGDACSGSVTVLGPAREQVRATAVPVAGPTKSRRELVNALNRLEGALTRCKADFAAMSQEGQAETVRGYSYSRSLRIQRILQDYEITLRRFLSLVGMELPAPAPAPHSAAG